MDDASVLRMTAPDPRWQLPADLRARDPQHACDIGWVEQMQPFLRHFSAPGELAFDPFAGFGTTLLAAHLEDRRGAGAELDPARAALARERLQRHGIDTAPLQTGDVRSLRLPPIDLCLTSVPYFGHRPDPGAASSQLYAATAYESYLEELHAIFRAVRAAMRPHAMLVAFAQTLRIGECILPLPFDLSRLLADLFQRCDERVLLYPRDAVQRPHRDPRSNRSHEYALVFRHAPAAIDPAAALELLGAMHGAGLAFELHGSFARWLQSPAAAAPADVDLLVAPQQPAVDALLAFLSRSGFHLRAWQRPLALPVSVEWLRAHHYVRAERHDATGRRLQIDVGVATPDPHGALIGALRVRRQR